MTLQPGSSRRYLYMDFLRVLACFLVIVNHTNSLVFLGATPGSATWGVSLTWYYVSKTAVTLFVMVSGACLLSKEDSYRRILQRVVRMLLVLILFSYGYYLLKLLKAHELWPQAFDLWRFFRSIWQIRISDSLWYLYFYIGLLLMLPFCQRLAKSMKKTDFHYLLGLTFGIYLVWPMVTHYVPALALPEFFDLSLFPMFIGLFFAGHYIHAHITPKRWYIPICGAVVICAPLIATGLTWLETLRIPPDSRYLFMDERTTPALPVVLCAVAMMILAKTCFALWEERGKGLSPKAAHRLAALGACSFTIFLLQDCLIVETRHTLFPFLCSMMHPFLAAILWEIIVFSTLVPVAWLLKKIPFLKKLL